MSISLPMFPTVHRPRISRAVSGVGPAPHRLSLSGGVSLAKEACMHPRGVFQSAVDFKEEGDRVYAGTLYWKGSALENEHSTRVRFKVEEGVAKI